MYRPFIAEKKLQEEAKRTFRQLTSGELQTRKWLRAVAEFLNQRLHHKPADAFTPEMMRLWLGACPEALVVVVEEQPSWLLSTQKVVAAARILPLTSDTCLEPGFNPRQIRPSRISRYERWAKAMLISELAAEDDHRFALCAAISSRLNNTGLPIYCDTDIALFQRVLAKRHGAVAIGHAVDHHGRTASQ